MNKTIKRKDLLIQAKLTMLFAILFLYMMIRPVFAQVSTGGSSYPDLNTALGSETGAKFVLTSDDNSLNSFEYTGDRLAINSNDRYIKSIYGARSMEDGGVLKFINDSFLDFSNINFHDNIAYDKSGGVLYSKHSISMNGNNVSFTENQAKHGGVISADGLTINGENILFSGNSTVEYGYGGAIFNGNWNYDNSANDLVINASNVSFIGNKSDGLGGAIYSLGNVYLNGNNINFTGNRANSHGAAIALDTTRELVINGSNITFVGNSTGDYGYGGALFLRGNLTINGGNILFYNNRGVVFDPQTGFFGNGTNSIYFEASDNNRFHIATNGNLLMYDPIIASASNNLEIDKTGTGNWLLGGKNITHSANWNLEGGTFILTRDSEDNTGSIISQAWNKTFDLGSDATMLVAADLNGNASQLDFSTYGEEGTAINLYGQVGIGSDYRYAKQTGLGERTLLEISGSLDNSERLVATSGVFGLGMYDYEYDSLHWENGGRDLVVNVNASYLNPDRSGGYSVKAPLSILLSDGSNQKVFERMGDNFDSMLENQDVSNAMWGSSFYSRSNTDKNSIYQDGSLSSSGIILGAELLRSKESFLGATVSTSQPKYNQGYTKIKSRYTQISMYGGNFIKGGLEIGYMAGAGFGKHDQSRSAGFEGYSSGFDSKSYFAGISLSKKYQTSETVSLRPFASYEYLYIDTDGYQEDGFGLSGISVAKHQETVSRMRLGLEMQKQVSSSGKLLGSVYFQQLYGDISPNSVSWFNSNPDDQVVSNGGSIDKNAVGFTLGWNQFLGRKANISLLYNGLYSANNLSNSVQLMVNYKF